MLDFARLRTPAASGEVLVEPEGRLLPELVARNGELVAGWKGEIGGVPIAEARAATRRAVVGGVDGPVIVTGHQPGFFHPGVWAKQVMARRLAEAVEGISVNLIVDNDAPKAGYVEVPVEDGDVLRLERVRFGDSVAGVAFEEMKPWSAAGLDAFALTLQRVMGGRFADSLVPAYLEGARSAVGADDWVTQTVAGRKAIDCRMGVCLAERRVSECWGGALLAEMVGGAERFVAAYNGALADYRVEQGVFGHDRPIPDLLIDGSRLELPVWVYRAGEVRRRLFLERSSGEVVLWAGHDRLGAVGDGDVNRLGDGGFLAARFVGVRFRPRALTLTLWARLLLGDLFIHGIGGAKYDRITDGIIERYFGWQPPRMACVSATLFLDWPVEVEEGGLGGGRVHGFEDGRLGGERLRGSEDGRLGGRPLHLDVGEAGRRVRDFRFNPQRYVAEVSEVLEGGEVLERGEFSEERSAVSQGGEVFEGGGVVSEMLAARRAAVAESDRLRAESPSDRGARRAVFERIRFLNERIGAAAADVGRRIRIEYEEATRRLADRRIADGREYWFGLYSERALRDLMERLPGVGG